MLTAQISRFTPNLKLERYTVKENAISAICDIWMPQWAISSESLIFLEPVELEIANVRQV